MLSLSKHHPSVSSLKDSDDTKKNLQTLTKVSIEPVDIAEALKIQKEHGCAFIHPFDDEQVIIGQGTLAKEILYD